MRFMLFLIFQSFKFSPKHSEYVNSGESKLLKNVRHVDYIAKYMEERNYEKALEAIKAIDVYLYY